MTGFKNTKKCRCTTYNHYSLEHNIVLIGFMGAGKSTVGSATAELLGVRFIETDEKIEKKTGQLISKIFEKYGEEYFRDLESDVIKELRKMPPGTCVVSTGGGAVLRHENISALKEIGKLVLLEVNTEEVLRRLKGKIDRPLLQGNSLMETIESLLEQRKDCYNRADYRVNTEGKKPREIAEEIICLLAKDKKISS